MITFDGVCPVGMFSFGNVPVINLTSAGRIFVKGINEDHNNDSNGSGKSSISNAIKEITFGKNDSGKSGAHVVNKHKDWHNGSFGAEWFRDHLDNRWRIFYLRKWKGEVPSQILEYDSAPSSVTKVGGTYTGTEIFLDRFDPTLGMWIDERPTAKNAKSLKDVHSKISQDILGISYDQFCAYVALGQHTESMLVQGTSGEREKIIQAIIDVSIWDKAADCIKSVYISNDSLAASKRSKIDGVKQAISVSTPPTQQEWDNANKVLNTAISQLTNAQNKHILAKNQLDIVKDNLVVALASVSGIDQEFDLLKAEERHSHERYNSFVEPTSQELSQINQEITLLNAKISVENKNLEKFTVLGTGNCSRCGLKITPEHIKTEVQQLTTTISEYNSQVTQLRSKADVIAEDLWTRVQAAQEQAKKVLECELSGIEASRQKLKERLAESDAQKHIVSQHEHVVYQEQTNVQMANNYVNDAKTQLSVLQNRTDQIDTYQKLLIAEQVELDILTNTINHAKWVERNLRKLKLQEYDSALDRLNTLVAEELMQLWGTGLTARFVTAQEKSKSGVKQELELLVNTINKEDIPIELYSGGEKKEIVVAVFKAGRRLVKERGLGVNIAVIDELDKDLSDSNTDRLVDAFDNISQDCSTCLVISHNSRLLNTMQFDAIWTVRKTNEFSNIEFA